MMTQYRTETDHDIDRAPSFARFYGAHAWPCSGAGAAERGQFAAGSGSIASTGTATTVTQSTARGVVNWQSFSIASGHSVQFENGSGATLNRVTGAQMSELQGHLGATGSLYLINPNGVVIGPNGSVATGGSFVASTRDASDSAFMQGKSLTLSGTSSGPVKNEGKITSTNGNVVLVGQSVSNSGTVSAANGTVALAAGNRVILSEAEGPDGIYVETDADAKGDVTNTGHIQAAAARLAAAGGNVYALAGNRDGLIQATGTSSVNGQVFLTAPHGIVTVEDTTVTASTQDGAGGTIRANGREVSLGSRAVLDASATQSGKKGGQVLVGTDAMGGVNLATRTTIASGATLKARGKDNGAGGDIETSAHTMALGKATIDAGVGGQWLLDPDDLTIDANAAQTINGSLAGNTNVTEQTTATTATYTNGGGTSSSGNGDIILNAPISWSTTSTLTLSAYRSITLNAGITVTGSGTLALVTNNNSGGTSGGGTLALNGSAIQFPNQSPSAGVNGVLTINGNAYTLISSVSDLQNIGASSYYALAHALDASSVKDFSPIPAYSGDFNGLGNTIANLTISSPDASVGLFGGLGSKGTIENIGIIGGSFTSFRGYNGGLVGQSYGIISNSYSTAIVSSSNGGSIGGLVGKNNGTIVNSYATGSVSGGTGSFIGGLTGANVGILNGSYATGNVTAGDGSQTGGLVGLNDTPYPITNAYATGNVSGGSVVGGLVGENHSSISDVYATGGVSGSNYVGGLIGRNYGQMTNVYATGSVSSANDGLTGALAGENDSIITNGYWDTQTSGQSTGAGGGSSSGLTGLTTAKLQATLPSGFNTSVWGNAGNQTTPYLLGLSGNQVFSVNDTTANLYTVVLNTSQLQAIQNNLAGRYVLGNTIDASGYTGFAPIGTDSTAFTGKLNGLGYTINNLVISSGAQNVGLIGYLGAGGSVQNIGMSGGSVSGINGDNGLIYVGGLVGYNSGTINNAYATGSVSGTGYSSNVGGLVGYSDGTISNAYATGNVSGTGTYNRAGGLVANNYYRSTISNAYATGNVSGSYQVGGLAAQNVGTISNVYATGSVTGTGYSNNVGGLVGENDGTTSNAYWDKETTGQSSSSGSTDASGLTTEQLQKSLPSGFDSAVWGNAGNQTTPYLLGLSGNQVFSVNDTGRNFYTVVLNTSQLQAMQNNLAGRYVLGNTIDASGYTGFAPIGTDSTSFTGTLDGLGYTINNLVISSGAQDVGLIGYLGSGGSVHNIGMVGGSVTGINSDNGLIYVGGLVGYNSGTINNAYTTGTVSGSNYVGGLVGENGGTISIAHATGNVSGTGSHSVVGGLVGGNFSTISDAYATGNISNAFESIIGGLVGVNFGTISNAHAIGSVTGAGTSSLVGGLVGGNAGLITDAYATGNVTGTGTGTGTGTDIFTSSEVRNIVGGLVGTNLGPITSSYASGNVKAEGVGGIAGGLVGYSGYNEKIKGLTKSVYATGNVSADRVAGGLIGVSFSDITDAYATGAVSSLNSGGYAGGLIGGYAQGTITNAYWDKTTSGAAVGIAITQDGQTSPLVTGLTTNEWSTKGPLVSGSENTFSNTAAWIAGSPYPVLSALPYIVIRANSATQVYGSSVINASGITYTDQTGADASGKVDGVITWQNAVLSPTSNADSKGAIYGTGATAVGYQVTYAPTVVNSGININTITRAPLTISASNQSGVYGQTPALGSTAFTTSGLLNEDRVTGVTLATDATAESPVGSYALSVSNEVGTGLGNYTITYRSALYEVTAAPSPVTPEVITPAPETVTPEVVTPVVITPVPETLTPEVVTTILTPTTPEAVIVVPTPTATAVALSRVYWPTPVTAPANGSFAGSASGSGVGLASGSTVQKSDASGNTAQSDSSNAGLVSDLTAENGAGLAYRITLPTTSILNQLRKAQ
ncbi:beta strand repeat-containing protein [Asaia astilbis]